MNEQFIPSLFRPRHQHVPSDTKEGVIYLVSELRPGHYRCSCPGFLYRCHDKYGYRNGKICKHIKRFKEKEVKS